jgi:hypothetical protein
VRALGYEYELFSDEGRIGMRELTVVLHEPLNSVAKKLARLTHVGPFRAWDGRALVFPGYRFPGRDCAPGYEERVDSRATSR